MEKKSSKFNLKGQVTRNTFIFKENLKIIVNLLIEKIWSKSVSDENISKIIAEKKLKKNFDGF